MAKTKAKVSPKTNNDIDGPYLLKLVLYLILGTFWITFLTGGSLRIPIPIGFAVGILLTRQERFQVDRKIEYAVLLIAMLVGYFASFGFYIQI